MTERRLNLELQDWDKYIEDGIMYRPIEDDVFRWYASIKGPNGSAYENGEFILELKFTENYPF